MILKVKKEIEESVVIELPCYRKDICHAYKVIDDKRCIAINHGVYANPYIQVSHAELAWNADETKDCTEEEFNKIFDEVLNRITTLKELSEVELIHDER